MANLDLNFHTIYVSLVFVWTPVDAESSFLELMFVY